MICDQENSKNKIQDVCSICFSLMTVELTCIQTLPYAICIAAAVRVRVRKWQLPLTGQWISVQEVSDACGYCSPFLLYSFLKFTAKQPGGVHWIFVLVLLAACCSRDLLEPVKPAGPAAPPPPWLHPALLFIQATPAVVSAFSSFLLLFPIATEAFAAS